MSRKVVASETFLTYLSRDSRPDSCIVGLILGQYTPNKDYVIHFAKTPPFTGLQDTGSTDDRGFNSINEIPASWIAEHAKHATRLLPGGMYVLGIFIVSSEDPFDQSKRNKLNSILNEVNGQLMANKYFYGVSPFEKRYILHYSPITRNYICKIMDQTTSAPKVVDFKFLSSKIEWTSVECFYELSQIFPIQDKEVDLSLKKHMSKILETLTKNLKRAVFLFNGSVKSKDQFVDIPPKKNKSAQDQDKPIQVSIILPSNCGGIKDMEIRDCGGHIKLSGQIASKIWITENIPADVVSNAIIEDIVRSLAARLEMHWDSLIEEEHGSPEDTNSIHEPPRRIFVKLPGTDITLSDYLFPGEGTAEAEISLEELLDITVNENDTILDAEGQADLTEFYNDKMEAESEDNLPKLPTETSKFMYMIGLGIALLVLLVSILVHFIQN